MFFLLIENKANLNMTILNKISYLIYSVLISRENFVPLLVKNGANINFQDQIGRTALMIAVEENNLSAVIELLKFDNNLGINDYSGKTVFDYAELSRVPQIKKILSSLKN